MKKQTQRTLLALLVLGAGVNQVVAAPTQVNITGVVVASPCTVDTTNSDLNVNLGTNIQATSLSTAGNTSTPVPFKLVVKDCPTTTSKVTASFSGTTDAAAGGRYATTSGTGMAGNVAVEVKQDAAPNALQNPGSTMDMTVVGNSATFALRASAYAKGAVTPGNIAAVMSVDFTYN
ncbi:S-fimbrial adhesin protein SfaS precursor [Serratia fonticola]|jgi:minor fimbrial subunit|uniref:fimbrial protein n=1 Tax=Serratia fonticola TaxID=47917 RepID=UPI002183554D|nr:fimbrial protein [Serratia fonticola]CAI2100105.1 S-fimbrial adhesin protein SfaS precursor [Serratia fonticola]